ncbi:hypothetical protein [Tenacibaculum jejuense]|uniref:Lipoprotein n=1 Tax=Tenacibaculum jejuense TaxID=584609 RepID=A0A238U651_9FLAO|nr:hypothetical protein [Tenacibaculum jejuense]SNR14582.1 protein of unknown function [Tenacibaculum jejuense]
MKLYYTLFIGVILLIASCKREKLEPFTPKNHLASFQKEKSQFFDLDTIYNKFIEGKHGTKFYFRRDLFDLKETDKVQLELIELYDFKEILYRNIQTLTTDNQLLESSGVLKIKFTSNGKELQLKEGEKLFIFPPKEKLLNNDIFLSESDSIGNITWNITDQNNCDIILPVGGGITERTTVACDSVQFYLNNFNLIKRNDEYSTKNESLFILYELGAQWINIDRFVKNVSKLNFSLVEKTEHFSGFDIYFIYENMNSFTHEARLENNLKFQQIPISGKTYALVVGSYKNQIYYDKIELKETTNNSVLSINMKKTTTKDLKRLFE